MSQVSAPEFDHLPAAAARVGDAAARPRLVATVCIVALTGLGWTYLGAIQATQPDFLAALCRPFGAATSLGAASIAPAAAMWIAMTLAMMLPGAAPTILTYAEIAEVAARKREPIVSPLVLTVGYAVVWIAFAVVATAAQFILSRSAGSAANTAGDMIAGALFVAAGLYQFSSLKQACLRHCRSPFQFFFTNWTTTPQGVFRLGVRQGLYCLGCCWAAMTVMVALGVMNVLWMAALAIVMTIEKLAAGKRVSYAIAGIFVVIGLAFMLSALKTYWPMNAA